MGLLDIFTGDAYERSAREQQAYYNQLTQQVLGSTAGTQQQGLAALQSGQYNAIPAITGGTSTARADISGSLDPALAALSGGVSGAVGAYNPLSSLAADYASRGTEGYSAYADALGLNGPEGIARSRSSFTTSPGYEFALNQGLDAISRGANTSGMLAGGNTLRAAGEYATNAANQEWQKYLGNLFNIPSLYTNPALAGTGAAASGISNALLTGGRGAADIYSGTARSLADLASRGGLATADVYTGTAGREADLLRSLSGQQTGFLQGIAPTYGKTFSDVAAAETGGSQNLWNLVGSLGTAAAGGGFLPSYNTTSGLTFGSAYGPYAPKPTYSWPYAG